MTAVPGGYGGGKDPLPGYAPVPFHGVGPVLQADAHVGGDPFYLLCHLFYLRGIDSDKPLLLGQDLNGGLAPPAEPYVLLQRLLLEDYPLLGQILGDLLFRLLYG